MPEPVDFAGRPAASGTRRAAAVGLTVLAFIALAVAKPWDAAPAHASPSPAPSAPLAASHASAGVPSPSTARPTPVQVADISTFRVGAPPTGPWARLVWTEIDPRLPLALVRSVVRWQGGFVALGSDGTGDSPVWTSGDGADWQPLPMGTSQTFWPRMRVVALVPFRGGLWGLTTEQPSPPSTGPSASDPTVLVSWASRDARSWLPLPGLIPTPVGLSGPVLVAASADRLVLAWNETTPDGSALARLWWSADGSRWQQVPRSMLPPAFLVTALQPSPDGGFLSGGLRSGEGYGAAVLLHSADGASWAAEPLPSHQLDASGSRAIAVLAVLPGASGVLADGSTDDNLGSELWWRSSDGRRWSEDVAFAPLGERPCPAGGGTPGGNERCGSHPDGLVAADGTRLAAVSSEGGSVWTSSDAAAWLPLRLDPGARPQAIDGAVLFPGGVLATAGAETWWGQAASD